MNAVEPPVLMGRDHMDITDYHDPAVLVALLREANERPADAPEGGFVWLFRLGTNSGDPTLALGARGEIGALAWYEDKDEFVPVNGLNEEDADCYWTWFGHEAPMPPRSEVPIEQVTAALDELIRTHRRPTCLE
ncbi:MAG TPA: Imm1 family immunity protein [Pseudonocardiaceae bacterium]|jgi:hypothetical protein|nr:Imm1 family immunity protein [Pseudonocardiaceae bacterium]